MGSAEFQLRDVDGRRLGKEVWVIGGTSDIVVDKMGVYVVLERDVRWGGGMVLRRAR